MTLVPMENGSAQEEHRHHDYVGNDIPWYVRLLWVGFWVWAIWLTIQYLLPFMRVELFQAP